MISAKLCLHNRGTTSDEQPSLHSVSSLRSAQTDPPRTSENTFTLTFRNKLDLGVTGILGVIYV